MIKEFLQKIRMKNKLGRCIYYNLKRIQKFPGQIIFEIDTLRCKYNIFDKYYHNLKNIKDKYKDERCFIIATGPSLTMEDLELLKNEFCFSMNSACKLFNRTNWRPNFYAVSDPNVYEILHKEIEDNVKCDIFIPKIYIKKFKKNKDNYIPFNLDWYYIYKKRIYRDNIDKNIKFSSDFYTRGYDGDTVVHVILQLAIYMGFKEIYLLGTDCNYKDDKINHIVDYGLSQKNASANNKIMLESYKAAKIYAENHGIKIINSTRGGKLEVFPRVSLEEVLKINKKIGEKL